MIRIKIKITNELKLAADLLQLESLAFLPESQLDCFRAHSSGKSSHCDQKLKLKESNQNRNRKFSVCIALRKRKHSSYKLFEQLSRQLAIE